jgi:hypothetical protein
MLSKAADNLTMESSLYDKKFNLRLPAAVFDRVEELSREYERSVNEQMVYMLKTWQEPSAIDERLARLENQVFAAESKKTVLADGERKAM